MMQAMRNYHHSYVEKRRIQKEIKRLLRDIDFGEHKSTMEAYNLADRTLDLIDEAETISIDTKEYRKKLNRLERMIENNYIAGDVPFR